MTALISNSDHNSLLTRRSIVIGVAASMTCAPATSLMPVRRLPFPYGTQSAGFVERLYLPALERGLRAASRIGRTNIELGGPTIPIDGARRRVAYAQAHGFLSPNICIYRSN
jgi:hypothetical protein